MVTRLKQRHVASFSTESSSEAMNSPNGDNGRKDISERRLTKPKTNSGTSLVSHRSIRPNPLRRNMSNDTSPTNSSATNADEDQSTPPQSSVNSITREQSTSNLKDICASVPRPTLRAHYKLHNPLGPRWYRNHHLIPPSHLKPSMRPPTFFSSSFPPIGTASPDHYDDEELSRSPSRSPLPTPESSQTRVHDGLKPRSRKTSQTAPDAIDLLDLSDPWGQSWHHKSPYEFGQTTMVASFDTTDLPNRTRCASFSVSHAHQRSVAPSPLSQSTSAVNLPSLQPEIKAPRKLSKRKTTNVTTIFQNSPPQLDRKASSVPATPIDAPVVPSAPLTSDSLPKRMSMATTGPFMTTPSPTPKREKRGSLLNRLVKKFSTLKRGSEPILGGIEGWNYDASSTTIAHRQSSSVAGNSLAFPEKPLVDGDSSGDRPDEDKSARPWQAEDRVSLSSLEIPYSAMGKLTVINPDPSDEETELVAAENPARISSPELNKQVPLPPENDNEAPSSPDPPEPILNDPLASPSDPEPGTTVDKPLPPRLGTPRFSGLVISEITVSTPQVTEQPLPPLPPKDVFPQESLPERDATSSMPPEPPEPSQEPHLSTIDPFHIVNSISLDHAAHETPPPPPFVQKQATPESFKQSPSQRKSASPPREASYRSVVERRDTPPSRESPKPLSGRRASKRNTAPPPEPAIERKTGSLRSTLSQVPIPSRELLAESKSPPPTTSLSKSVPGPRTVPVPIQAPSLVPFPASIEESHSLYADSPLSKSSVLVNPPTPYDHRISINVSEISSTPPTLPPKTVLHQSPPPPKTTGTAKRQTETFKLVRSLSGNVYASSQTILVQGQQWEVVESVETMKKDRSLRLKGNEKNTRDHERERELDREREREELEREKERQRQRAREKELEREKQRAREREREMELQKEKAREERERREAERMLRELEIQKEKERAKERERREAERLQREVDLQKEWERAREWERREAERQREREKEKERERERARQREREKERERERQREKDREREHKERERQREKEKEREHEQRERERERRKERERRERERQKEKERERRREREREKGRDREERERLERERERERRARERIHEEDLYRERKPGHYDRKSRDHDRKSREYERRSRDYEPRTDGSEQKARDEGRQHDSDRRPAGYDLRESRHHEKLTSRHYEDPRPHDDRRHSRKHGEHQEHRPPRHPAEPPSSSYSQHQPELDVQAIPNPEPQPVRLERMPSMNARPISQLPSADEMNAVRAKEQWEMERLWKARSLHGLEPNGTTNHVIPEHSSSSSMSDDIPEIDPSSPVPLPPPELHGSSHTAYLVQAPFHDSRTQIYRSMPTAPPPIYYHSPASIPSIPDSISSYEPYETLRFYPGPAQVAEPIPLPSFPPKSNNPLPEPPRESSYNPATLSSMSPSKRRSTEYWTFNGITTAH